MFNINKTIGNHQIYNYDTNKHQFIEYMTKLYNTDKLEELHILSKDYNDLGTENNVLTDRETDLHKIFYHNIKNDDKFKTMYCSFIRDIYDFFFPEEECLIYQSFPSIRFQFEGNVTVPPHCDSDSLGNHPIGEKNFLIPITRMINTNSLHIETEPGKKDFQPIELKYGEVFYFNGNKCVHYNKKNEENFLRISFDFRILCLQDYLNYINNYNITYTKPRDPFNTSNRQPQRMLIGGYYQIYFKKEPIENMLNWYNNNEKIVQHKPSFDKEEAEACYRYMLEDNYITEHKKTLELEKMISTYLNCKHCIMTTSGTTAIILALMALELELDDEVLVPNFTMIATINSIKMLNLKPIIIDIDEDTGTVNLDIIKQNITNKTKCVIHVSLNNRYKNIEEIVSYCNQNTIYLIEDSAQSLGCKINNKNLGTFGDMGCFSLSTPKIISTGQGGFIATNNDNFNNVIRMKKNFGRKESGIDDFITFGINLKFTDIQAVIGIEQMKKLDYRVNRLKDIYNIYYHQLEKLIQDNKILMKKPLSDEWLPWFVDIYIDNRDELVEYLKIHNIVTRPVYGEINQTNMYKMDKVLVNSRKICNTGLFLPSYIKITNNDIKYICDIIKTYY